MINLLSLQDYYGGLLEADADVTAALGSHDARILGGPNPTAVFPYLTIGEDESLDVSVQFLGAKRVRSAVHVWTKEDGFAACKSIEAAVVAAMETDDEVFIADTNLRIVSCFHENSRFIRDPREGVRHGVVEFSTEIEATD